MYTNQILMKQGKIIQEKQELNLTIPRFGMYLFSKIKKLFKKLSATPKIQGLVFDYALNCQFNQFFKFFFNFSCILLSTQFNKNIILFLFIFFTLGQNQER
jgi:hypothetical protein